ncbi:MAG: hypothetical protein ABIQ90_09585 [Polaromonas sp.]
MKKQFKSSLVLLFWCASLPLAMTTVVRAQASSSTTPASPSAVRPARQSEDKEQLERRLASVATLIEKSSAAKQIEASANPEALVLRGKARELRQQADEAYKSGNYANASRMLDQAAKLMFEGVHLAAPSQLTGAKDQRDFDSRMESVKALLAALKRINTEKNQGLKGTQSGNTLDAQTREAAALAAAGKVTEGRVLLDKVYVSAKQAIEGLREGETLVRSLNFASKEEEYHYEIDRNDTHKMLIKVLLDEKRATNAGLDGMVQKSLEQATVLRGNAEAMAAKKDFDAGIKLLEDSTKELVRAIRSAGVYIPG